MTNAHLYNTIKMLDRVADNRHEHDICGAFMALATVQGEMATQAIESAIAEMDANGPELPGDLWPIYDRLVVEAKRRGIDLDGPVPSRTVAEIRRDFPSDT